MNTDSEGGVCWVSEEGSEGGLPDAVTRVDVLF